MNKKQIFWLILCACGVITILTFALSSLTTILRIISSGFLTIALAMLSWLSFGKYKRDRVTPNVSSEIDELLINDEINKKPQQKNRLTFKEKSENFSNRLLPYALVFFTICAFSLFIALITM